MNKRVNEYLRIDEIGGQKVIKCAKCQYAFCAATQNYKEHALMKESSPAEAGTFYKDSKRFVFREFYCPQCATLFDVEVRLKGQPFLWDSHLEV